MTGLHAIRQPIPEDILLACASLLQYLGGGVKLFRMVNKDTVQRRSPHGEWSSFPPYIQKDYRDLYRSGPAPRYIEAARRAFVW